MRKFSLFFFVVLFCSFLSITASADTYFEPFSHFDTSYDYGFSMTRFPHYGALYDDDSDATLVLQGYDHITSTNVDGITYNTRTLEYVPDSVCGLTGLNLVLRWNYLWSYYGSDYFTDFDLYFLVNVYGYQNTLESLNLRAILTNVLYADELSYSPHGLLLQASLVDIVERAWYETGSSSYTYIYQLSYHGDPVYFDLSEGLVSSLTLDFYVQNFSGEIVDQLYTFDIGILDARIGRVFDPVDYDSPFMPPGINDIWAGLQPLPMVVYPSFGESSVSLSHSDLFERISELSLVSILIVPIGVLAMSFFVYRLILWKGP